LATELARFFLRHEKLQAIARERGYAIATATAFPLASTSCSVAQVSNPRRVARLPARPKPSCTSAIGRWPQAG